MRRTYCAHWGLFLCLLFALAVLTRHVSAQPGDVALHVGMPTTFFHDLPPALVRFATEPFRIVLRDSTGLSGELMISGDAFATAAALSEGKLQLAVFHSFEFGWVQQKYPELKPLMVAIHAQHPVSAHMLVGKNSTHMSFVDLKGKPFSLPKRTREQCRLYIEHYCQERCAGGAKEFFGRVIHSANVESALDELCRGELQAVVVDSIGLEFYKALKPGCFERLKVLAEAEFPPAVVAYRPGAVDEATINRLRKGMCAAHKTELGREMMKLWQITSFDSVPANFTEAVAACIKSYPYRHK